MFRNSASVKTLSIFIRTNDNMRYFSCDYVVRHLLACWIIGRGIRRGNFERGMKRPGKILTTQSLG